MAYGLVCSDAVAEVQRPSADDFRSKAAPREQPVAAERAAKRPQGNARRNLSFYFQHNEPVSGPKWPPHVSSTFSARSHARNTVLLT